MNIVENKEFEGERPLFYFSDLSLSKIKVLNGESAIKECTNVTCTDSSFCGKYPFWHANHALIEKCVFETGGRAAIWYSHDLTMKDTLVIAPKMFRRCSGLKLENVEFTDALETLWDCTDITASHIKAVHADYIFMNMCPLFMVQHIPSRKLQTRPNIQHLCSRKVRRIVRLQAGVQPPFTDTTK